MVKTNLRTQPQQLDLFLLQAQYPEQIIDNSSLCIDLNDLDLTKNVLVCNVKKDNMEHFMDGTAKLYYSGKRFPSTVAQQRMNISTLLPLQSKVSES